MPRTQFSRRRLVIALMVVIPVVLLGIYILRPAPKPTVLLTPPLRQLADTHQLQIGNFAILNHIGDPRYSDILSSQFHFVLADNTPNWYFTDGGMRPGRHEYNYREMDRVMQYARDHGMPVQAHHFVWGEDKWLPDWLKNGNYSRDELLQIIDEHIATVGGHYKGQIREWSVVNEAFGRNPHTPGLHDWWADHIGDKATYIDRAFIAARAADPSAVLILNDFNNEQDGQIARDMYDYVKSAKARGIPIDAVGMQMHIDTRTAPSKQQTIDTMRKFASLGVKVYVTEFDVNTSGMFTTNAAKDRRAAQIYYDMTRACIESGVCPSFAQLGITDKETWYNYMGPSSWNARPLMFDEYYRAKDAYYAFRRALSE